MKLFFSLTLIWALAYTAKALQCVTCTNQACSSTALVPCNTETMCIAATIQVISGGTPGTQPYQACASPSLCPAVGNATFSVDIGVASAIASAQCCNTDNCNSAPPPAAPPQTANNLQCIYCNPSTSACSPLPCKGPETECFSSTVTSASGTGPVLGCISPNTCAVAASLGSLPFMSNVGNITSGPSCCGGNLCNSPTTTTTPTTTPLTTTTPTTTPPPTPTTTTTTTTASVTTTAKPATTSDASNVQMGILNLLLGLFIFML